MALQSLQEKLSAADERIRDLEEQVQEASELHMKKAQIEADSDAKLAAQVSA